MTVAAAPEFREASADGRYSRQELVAGWRQSVLREARILVVGAGALGNEALKNLALLGLGHITIVDFDLIEGSNLSRCVLFRKNDTGQPKAAIAARRVAEMNPDVDANALLLDVRSELGAGTLRDYDLVLGCVDTIEARLALNRLCRAAGVPWLDGGMDARGGQVSYFDPATGPCYECGMTASMWTRIYERQSCMRLGSGMSAAADTPMPATALLASLIGALLAQEAVRSLHAAKGQTTAGAAPMRTGQRLCLQTAPYEMLTLEARQRADCPAHEFDGSREILSIVGEPKTITLKELLNKTDADTLQLEWDVVVALHCIACGESRDIFPASQITRERLLCDSCGRLRQPVLQSSFSKNDAVAATTLASLGVPPRAILTMTASSKNHSTSEEFAKPLRVELYDSASASAARHAHRASRNPLGDSL